MSEPLLPPLKYKEKAPLSLFSAQVVQLSKATIVVLLLVAALVHSQVLLLSFAIISKQLPSSSSSSMAVAAECGSLTTTEHKWTIHQKTRSSSQKLTEKNHMKVVIFIKQTRLELFLLLSFSSSRFKVAFQAFFFPF